ncbi:MAG TPA: STM3941 family protein, partial [Pyrinomonadaceae bacterium]|nr:STM3941 family protein [Pyrinomonadaceae bacterium]
MGSHDETIIGLSRTKLVLTILGSCALVAAGAWLLSLDAARIRSGRSFNFFFNEPSVAYGTGLVSILFFGLCGLYAFSKLFDRKPGLVLNSDGVVDNASGVAAGFIPWSEVLGSGVCEVQKQKMLIVGVRDPQKYIARGGALKRALNQANYRMTGSPVAIPSVALKIDFSELVSLFNRYHQ